MEAHAHIWDKEFPRGSCIVCGCSRYCETARRFNNLSADSQEEIRMYLEVVDRDADVEELITQIEQKMR